MTTSRRCRWPHCGLSNGDELLLDVLFARHAAFIRRAAEYVAKRSEVEVTDLVQEALIRLWQVGPQRAILRGDRYVRKALLRWMWNTSRNEWRSWSRGREPLTSAA